MFCAAATSEASRCQGGVLVAPWIRERRMILRRIDRCIQSGILDHELCDDVCGDRRGFRAHLKGPVAEDHDVTRDELGVNRLANPSVPWTQTLRARSPVVFTHTMRPAGMNTISVLSGCLLRFQQLGTDQSPSTTATIAVAPPWTLEWQGFGTVSWCVAMAGGSVWPNAERGAIATLNIAARANPKSARALEDLLRITIELHIDRRGRGLM